jgi:uncharacterized membrane protein
MIETPMYNHLPSVPDWVQSVVFPLNRWLHIVSMATLVGGTLFYEFVIPKAIEELKDETQLAVLGRVRWIFRRLVIFSTIVLILSGAFETWQIWPSYKHRFTAATPWWSAHVALGAVAMGMAVLITLGDRVPRHPIAWLRVSFVVMLVAIFLAALTRHVRLSLQEDAEIFGTNSVLPDTIPPMGPWIEPNAVPLVPLAPPSLTTAPTTAP